MNKITGIILTHNNERTIVNSVRSIKSLIDELIIVDDMSTDQTLAIIKAEYPAVRIVFQKMIRFDEQRNYGLSLANNDWVLMIDSDEVVTSGLSSLIKSIVPDDNIDGYRVLWENQLFSVYLKAKNSERFVLFKKQLKFVNPVHEKIVINESRIGELRGLLRHDGWVDIVHDINKMNIYSGLLARKWLEQNRNYSTFQLLFFAFVFPVFYFFDCLFHKGFYRAGINGVIYAALSSSSWLVVILKYRELRGKA